jgi:N-hydroxyarylamine O-acetyltransferase
MLENLANNELSADGYLERIGYSGPVTMSEKTLFDIHEAHSFSVPYENLEIIERKPLSLDFESLYNKIVARRRGGYCFEINGIFSWLLAQLGFAPREYFGRWIWKEPLPIPMKRHRISKVTIQGTPYICDVGVGAPTYVRPLVFEVGLVQEQYGLSFRILKDDVLGFVVQKLSEEGEWEDFYSFTEEVVQPIDFYYAHYWCTTHEDSMFLRNTMVHMPTKYGRNTIGDIFDPVAAVRVREFRRTMPDGSVQRFVPRTKEAYESALKECFGIVL